MFEEKIHESVVMLEQCSKSELRERNLDYAFLDWYRFEVADSL